ncbi:glycerol-3-phosphate 1-O-acyltransferase PlsY [Bowmanella sp. JS7-9]|uniref:Glycerol-3-phosphate acyltransferase n=1 Tax=Pseudobowmanella zhangzhouensis TaxID=1537679 RepID=A0ABW1XLD6_9ALTE|nr:glycerol-3-phosphate 1-O-acyltransferase PlsY [Bowmanella sp. JS7-9]TBX20307.1 glycerol-3-phosphate acyltransferase [Bowmanella sp. JS7-9]
MAVQFLLMLVFAYLAGSVSSAVLISQLFRLPDPRRHGSKNPGTTNVYRLGGKIPALLTLVVDVLKGTIPVWTAYFVGLTPVMLGWIAIAACIGHIYPLYFGFKGGKAVATALGTMLPIGLDLSGLLIFTWLGTIFLTGYSSVSALVTVLLAPFYTWLIKPQYTIPVAMISILIIARHRSNILRLFRGQESRVWDKGKINE